MRLMTQSHPSLMKPTIAITLGDPAGIGPEIVAKALNDPRVRRMCNPIILGDARHVPMGKPSREGGLAALEALRQGLDRVRSGQAVALATAPVSKEAFQLAGHDLPGHTEWLARESGVQDPAMLMVSKCMRAILLTRHIPLREVPRSLRAELIVRAAELGDRFLRTYERVRRPRLVACGVNPHAGDRGILGTEELSIYKPAIALLKKRGIRLAGPVSSDAAFVHMAQGRYDLALAAYHDQGMIPLKLYAPECLVNVTLGLPFIRTSPGHGTAYDIAGKGIADARPMVEAILLAARYSRGMRHEGQRTKTAS